MILLLQFLKWWPPKDTPTSFSPEPVNLLGKGVFADITKDLEMRRSSFITWVGPQFNDKCSYKRNAERDFRQTRKQKRRKQWDHGGSD